MTKESVNLTKTQSNFIEYVNSQGSIVEVRTNGHFGMEYALKVSYKNCEIISFSEVASTEPRILEKIIEAIEIDFGHEFDGAGGTGKIGAKLKGEDVISALKTLSTRITRFWKRNKIGENSVHTIIIAKEEETVELEKTLKFIELKTKLKNKSKKGYLVIECIGLEDTKSTTEFDEVPLFELTKSDLQHISQEFKVFSEINDKLVPLIRGLGLEVYRAYASSLNNIIDLSSNSKVIENTDTEKLINVIINAKDLSQEEKNGITDILKFASIFESHFTKEDLIKISEDANLDGYGTNIDTYIDSASELYLVSKNSKHSIELFYFDVIAFKKFYEYKYLNSPSPSKKDMFNYLREHHPFSYRAQLKTQFLNGENLDELLLISYYNDIQHLVKVNKNFYEPFFNKSFVSSQLISEHIKFKKDNARISEEKLESIVRTLENQEYGFISKSVVLSIVLQIQKEFLYLKSFSKNLRLFKSVIDENPITDNCTNYEKYWYNEFLTQYVALSLEDDSVNTKDVGRKYEIVLKWNKKIDLQVYIDRNNLRNFDRIDLLAYSLDKDDAEDRLKELLESKSPVVRLLAKINLSAYLIEHRRYEEASQLFLETDESLFKAINIDTYIAYKNNYLLSQLKTNTISVTDYCKSLNEVLEIEASPTDSMLARINLYTIMLENNIDVINAQNILKTYVQSSNEYSDFMIKHNLFGYYCLSNEVELAKEVQDKIKVPKLLSASKTFFENKFEWMINNTNEVKIETIVDLPTEASIMYKSPLLYCTIERWFE